MITVDGTKVSTDQEALNALDLKVQTLNGVNHGLFNDLHEDILTINADTTKFDIKSFDYFINGNKYSFAGETGRSASFVPGDDFVIVYADENGIQLNTKNTFMTPEDLQTKIEIGGMATSDGSNIITVGNSHFDGDEFIRNLYVWSKFGKKTNFIGLAGAITENVTPLRLDIASGDIIDPNLNKETISNQLVLSAVKYNHVAGNWDLSAIVTPLVVDNTQYDDGTDLVTLNNNKWASHTIARSSRTGTIYFIYSQGQYDNEAEAIDADYSLGGFGQEIGNEIEPLAKLVIEKGSTSIDNIIDIRGLTSNIVSASTSTMQTTYDRSIAPQVTLANGKPIEYRNSVGDAEDVLWKVTSNNGTSNYFKIGKYVNTHHLGWRDSVALFSSASQGGGSPTLTTFPNGVRLNVFGAGDSMHVSYHVDHDYAEGTLAYHHIHWFPQTTMNAGDTVTWKIFFIVAKGHHQGESLLGTRNEITLIYTADGTEIAGEHIISEVDIGSAYLLKEPDTIVLAEIEMDAKTYAGNVVGIQADLHYQTDREYTVGKKPDFNVPD